MLKSSCLRVFETLLADNKLHSERGDDTVGNPHRAQIVQFEFFQLILLLK